MGKITDLLEELSLLNLPLTGYVIVGSGPLGIRGIREPQDLDILVDDDLWKKLAREYGIISKHGDKMIKISDNIEVLGRETFSNGSSEDPTIDDQINSADLIDGYPFQSIEHLQSFKKKMGRQKDLDDIALLQKWTDVGRSSEAIIKKEDVLVALRKTGFEGSMGLVIKWTKQQEASVTKENASRASIVFNIERADLYIAAEDKKGALECLEDARFQANQEGEKDLYDQIMKKMDEI